MRASLRIICIGFALAAALVVLSDAPASSEVIQFNCTYQTFYNGTDHRTQDAQDFKLQFTIDTVSNKAVLIGNQGVEEVTLVTGAYGFTFLEYLSTGAVQTTTISKSGASVHSRHSLMGDDEIVPSQYYGSCR